MKYEPRKFRMNLQHTEELSPSVRRYFFRDKDGQRVPFVARQWFNLDVPTDDNHSETRSYSVSGSPTRDDEALLEFTISAHEDGYISKRLTTLPLGTELCVEGPFGIFTLREEAFAQRELVFLGTGTGVAPLRSMIAELSRTPCPTASKHPDILLLFGGRDVQDVLFREEFEALTQSYPGRFRYEVTLSRADERWQGRRGYVQHHLKELVPDATQTQFYLCGSSNMIVDARKLLKEELGADRSAIRTERFDA